jgi:hypothetical protein
MTTKAKQIKATEFGRRSDAIEAASNTPGKTAIFYQGRSLVVDDDDIAAFPKGSYAFLGFSWTLKHGTKTMVTIPTT